MEIFLVNYILLSVNLDAVEASSSAHLRLIFGSSSAPLRLIFGSIVGPMTKASLNSNKSNGFTHPRARTRTTSIFFSRMIYPASPKCTLESTYEYFLLLFVSALKLRTATVTDTFCAYQKKRKNKNKNKPTKTEQLTITTKQKGKVKSHWRYIKTPYEGNHRKITR